VSRSRHGKGGQRKAGAHKNRRSPEVQAWRELSERADWLQPTESGDAGGRDESSKALTAAPVTSNPPPRPSWLTPATYGRLLALRESL
jgi:hypothetical protein